MPNYLHYRGVDNLSKNFRCLCSDHKDSTPSMTYYADTQTVHCHGCGFHGDIFSLYAKVENEHNTPTKEDFEGVYEFCGLTTPTGRKASKPKNKPIEPPPTAKKMFVDRSDEISKYAANIEQTDYWSKRGLTLDTVKHFNIGFCADWQHPDSEKMPKQDRLIIPTGDGVHQYAARRVDGGDDKFKIIKVGNTELFNLDGFNSDHLIVCEGEIDAMSIWQLGFTNVVGLGGIGNKGKFIEAISKRTDKLKFVIIALDNDERGITTAKEIDSELDKLNIYSLIINEKFEQHKDANGLLQHDSDTLKDILQEAIEIAQEAANKRNEDTKSNNLPELPDNLKFEYETPAGYIVDLSGIYQVTAKGEQKRISKSPVIISKRIENIDDGIHKICISCCKYGRNNWKTSPAVPYSTIANKQKIISLSDNDIDVNSNTAGKLVEYLSDFEATNIDNIPKVKAVNKLGWRGEKTFITPYNQSDFVIDTSKNTFAAALTQKGDFDKWLDVLAEIRQHDLARFITDAALAAPLLYILKERTFSIYMNADSRAGKTAVQKFGGSAWGNPDEVTKTFNCTINGLEVAAAMRSDFPFIIDEKQLAESQNPRNRLDMIKILYLLGEEEGKSRMDRNTNERAPYRWRTISIAGGETTIISDEATQGAITRTLIFNVNGQVLPSELSKKSYNVMKHNYGHAGQKFIDELLKEDFDKLRDYYNDINEEAHQNFKKHIDDHIRYVALISLADFLINLYFFKINKETAFNEACILATSILNKLQTQEELSDVQREWNFLTDWIVGKNVNFLGSVSNNKSDKPVEVYGEYKGDYLYIKAGSLKKAAGNEGFNHLKMLKDFKKAGYIIPDKENNSTMSERINGIPTRCLKIARAKLEN